MISVETNLGSEDKQVETNDMDTGCADEQVMVCGVGIPESSCSPREKENILTGELKDNTQDKENIENQSQSIILSDSVKRNLPEDLYFESQRKKPKLMPMAIQKLISDPVVKLERSPAVEQLIIDYKKREDVKKSIGDWPGWKYPNPGLRHSQKILQKLIDETEQLCRGKAASKQWQATAKHLTQTVSKRSDQNKNLIECLEQVLSTLDKTVTVNQTTTGRCEKVMIEGSSGFCGFDLDMMVGHFRGWDKPKTKSRDELKRKISQLEESLYLMSVLEEADHAMTYCNMPQHYKQQGQNKSFNKEVLRKEGQENKLYSRIEEHLKELMKYVADKPSLEPPFSYMVLAIMALKSSPQSSLPLCDIIQYIQNQFPYYRTANDCWMNSLRQTIHWSDFFIKKCPSSCHSKKSQDHGGCWTVDPVTAEAVLERAVNMQNRKTGGNLRFVSTSLPPLSTNRKHSLVKKKITHTSTPVKLLQSLKTDRNLVYIRTSLSPLLTNRKHSLVKKKIMHTSTPAKLLQPLKTANNLCNDTIQESPVIKVKRKKINVKEVVDKAKRKKVVDKKPCNKIHLILKAAENLDTQNSMELTKTKKKDWNHKENVVVNKDIRVKIKEHIEDLIESVSDNLSMEPPFSYMVLVVMALESSPQPNLPLQDIYQFIKDKFPYYRTRNESWMKIVQQTINWSDVFMKTCLRSCNGKKCQDHGGCWTIDPVIAEGILERAVEAHIKKGNGKRNERVDSTLNSPKESSSWESNDDNEVSTSAEDSQETKNFQLSSYPSSEETADTTDIQLSVKRSSKCSQESSNYELLSDKASDSINSQPSQCLIPESIPDTLICQLSPKLGSQKISETRNKSSSYQVSYEKFVETIVLDSDESSDSSEVRINGNIDSIRDSNGVTSQKPTDLSTVSPYQTLICHDCGYTFVCMFYLKYHKCTKGTTDTVYPCYLCHTPFKDELEFCTHLQTYHRGIVNKHDLSPLCWTMKQLKFLNKKSNYRCKQCPALYPFQELLDAHVRYVHY